MRRHWLAAALVVLGSSLPARADEPWRDTLAKARGQTVYWNAWGGDERTNAFITWVGGEVRARYGITVQDVKLSDTAEAVTRIIAEKTAGRDKDGSVDLVWINGPNFLAMKQQDLLHPPFAGRLPSMRFVDTINKPSTMVDFTLPTEGMESPWRMAQFVFNYDSARIADVPRSMQGLAAWASKHPGRFTHPDVQDFLGVTFLKQALVELAPEPALLQRPATDATFAAATEPLWAWYDGLKPHLWHGGTDFPASGPAERALLNDGEIDLSVSFDPAEAAGSIEAGLLPATVRTSALQNGSIGNTSFVAIPFNAPHPEAAMVVADFLLEPSTQAHAQDIRVLGSFTVLDLAKLSPEQRQIFTALPTNPALPTNAELGPVLLEPHPSWMTRITEEWRRRYTH